MAGHRCEQMKTPPSQHPPKENWKCVPRKAPIMVNPEQSVAKDNRNSKETYSLLIIINVNMVLIGISLNLGL